MNVLGEKYINKNNIVLIYALLVCFFRNASTLLGEQQTLSHGIREILQRHFADIRSISITFPNFCSDTDLRSLKTSEESPGHERLVEQLISNVGNFTAVNVHQELQEASVLPEDGTLEQGYLIIFFGCKQAKHEKGDDLKYINSDVELIFENQLLYQLKNKVCWNARAKFLVVALPHSDGPNETLALRLSQSLWNYAKVSNFLILIPDENQKLVQREETAKVAVYSWFPYLNGNCGEVDEITLLDEWVYSNGTFSAKNVDLFSYNLPTDFQSCPLTISALGPEPYVVVTRNYTNSNGSVVYDVEGLGVNLIHSFGQKYNFTLHFLPPQITFEFEDIFSHLDAVYRGESDVLTGCIPLMLFFTVYGDVTFPIVHEGFYWVVPCPSQLPRMERVVRIFTLPTWLAIGSVMFVASMVMCLQAHYYEGELSTYREICSCLLDTWAVLLSVSVHKLPKTINTRRLFIMNIWYCFVISLMFQTFFVTYLVEPGYNEPLRTLDDLQRSKLPYGFIKFVEFILLQTSYNGHNTLLSPRIECLDMYECTEKVMFERNMASLSMQLITLYIALKKGERELNNVVCFLEEELFSGALAMSVKKGNPLLDILNAHLSRSIQGGLQEKYWTDLKYKIRLQQHNLEEKLYFVFSSTHMSPIFMMLIYGHVISIAVFSLEIMYSYYIYIKRKAALHCPYKTGNCKATIISKKRLFQTVD